LSVVLRPTQLHRDDGMRAFLTKPNKINLALSVGWSG